MDANRLVFPPVMALFIAIPVSHMPLNYLYIDIGLLVQCEFSEELFHELG